MKLSLDQNSRVQNSTVPFVLFTIAFLLLTGCAHLDDPAERRASADSKNTVTVLTYNIHHGEGLDGKIDLVRIASILSREKPDFVALQEVDQNASRSGKVDQAGELARLTGMHHVFGKAMDFQGGAYGQAILSRWPIKSHKVHLLPQRSGREPRIAVAAEIDGPVPGFVFSGTHLDHQLEDIRVEQARTLNGLLASNQKQPGILVGDFNAVPSSETFAILTGKWNDAAGTNAAPTIPAGNPRNRIDYIFYRPGANWEVIRTSVLNEPVASDHRPVVAVLRFKP